MFSRLAFGLEAFRDSGHSAQVCFELMLMRAAELFACSLLVSGAQKIFGTWKNIKS